MEAFVDPKTHKSLTKLTIKEGETIMVALRKFDVASQAVEVDTNDSTIASCHQSVHLKDGSKKSYIDHYDMDEISKYFDVVDLRGYFYFQICGISSGETTLYAENASDDTTYAEELRVETRGNPKHLYFATTPGSPEATFDKLWLNHPKVKESAGKPVAQICTAKLAGSCMLNFSSALEDSGVDVKSLNGSVCGLKGHNHHYTNPYDFESWKKYSQSHYEWSAKGPLQKEPMPGFAAFDFMAGRQGIVLFWNYWDSHYTSAMFGGHIDLWNKDRMGNSLSKNAFRRAGEGAFYRARKISFWPMDEHKRER